MGVASGSGWNLWAWLAGGGWNLWAWLADGWNLCICLVGVVVRRYIDYPYSSCICSFCSIPCSLKKKVVPSFKTKLYS